MVEGDLRLLPEVKTEESNRHRGIYVKAGG